MDLESRVDAKNRLKIYTGVVLYAFALYTFGLMIKEIDKGKFLNASLYGAMNFTSATSAKILIGMGIIGYANRIYNNVKNKPKETRELIRFQMDGFISRKIYNDYNNLGVEHEDL